MLHPMHSFLVIIRDIVLNKADIHPGLDQAFLCLTIIPPQQKWDNTHILNIFLCSMDLVFLYK